MMLRLPLNLTSLIGVALICAALLSAPPLYAFCGFYVARADTGLYNQSSSLVIARDDQRTAMTMASDYRGEASEFALVVPVPVVPEESDVSVVENAVIEHLDAYSSPRLVEYFDPDPCRPILRLFAASAPESTEAAKSAQAASALGVTIEASYTVGEYDILVLSAEQSSGLLLWLDDNGYQVPLKAKAVVESYLKQDMKFLVARVNLGEFDKSGRTFLRPIQVRYSDPRFIVPIRLGTVNADGKQDLFLFTLTKKGRVEPVNYRQVRIPTDINVPAFVKDDFASVYTAMFDRLSEREAGAVVLEYAWDMGWCDPCAADPLSPQQLQQLGVEWLRDEAPDDGPTPRLQPNIGVAPPMPLVARPSEVFITRMHVRYDATTFPEDIVLMETGDRDNFQGRMVIQHPWRGEATCEAATDYLARLPERQQREAETLARVTGWSIQAIQERVN